jgi:hypothetical protein
MPVPSAITDLSTTAASNSPAGAESARGTIDDYLRAHASFIAQTRAGTSATTYTFSATGARIQGDFSNATLASRMAFQTSTANEGTAVYALPNGTGTTGGFYIFNNSNPTTAAYAGVAMSASGAAAQIVSANTGSGSAVPLTFNVGTGGPEVARFTTASQFLVGRTSYSSVNSNTQGFTVLGGGQVAVENQFGSGSSFYSNIYNCSGNACNNVQFYREGVAAGVIVTNSSNQTSYAASSDYRLKNDPQPLTGSGALIDALQPKTWTWDTSGQPGAGFIAHEVAAVSPSSVFGEKDAVNADGSPKYQSMEYGSPEFIANIVAELQSLRARVAALEAA